MMIRIKQATRKLAESPRVSLADIVADPWKSQEAQLRVFDCHRYARWPAARRKVQLRQEKCLQLEAQTELARHYSLLLMTVEVELLTLPVNIQ